MRSFEEIPRVPVTRLLGQIFATGARRYEMRKMQAKVHREFGPVAVMGGGRFANVFLFGPDANRAVLLDRADSLSSREPWMLIMGTIFPNGLLLRDGAEHRHHRRSCARQAADPAQYVSA
jgi:cytochrome P450